MNHRIARCPICRAHLSRPTAGTRNLYFLLWIRTSLEVASSGLRHLWRRCAGRDMTGIHGNCSGSFSDSYPNFNAQDRRWASTAGLSDDGRLVRSPRGVGAGDWLSSGRPKDLSKVDMSFGILMASGRSARFLKSIKNTGRTLIPLCVWLL